MGKGQGKRPGGAGRDGRAGATPGTAYQGGRIRWDAGLRNEARYEPNGDILLGPRFFALDQGTRVSVLAHELAHGLVTRFDPVNSGATFERLTALLQDPRSPGSLLFGMPNVE